MSNSTHTKSSWVFDHTEALTKAMGEAVKAAVKRHKLLGNPIAVAGENGGVKIIQPEDIIIDEDAG